MRVDDLGHAPEMAAVTTMTEALPAPRAVHTYAVASGATGPVGWRARTKRLFDIVLGSIVLLAVLPVLLLLALGVRISSPGPILFRQTRVGRHGRRFTMLKFRTFPSDHVPPSAVVNQGEYAVIPVEESPFRFGRLLRQTSLDELPQLINVLRGDMSLVGPRPERPELVAVLSDRVPRYYDRFRAPAGITGHAQVLGYCGTTPIEARVSVDNAYIDEWTVPKDFVILLKTVPTLLRKFRA